MTITVLSTQPNSVTRPSTFNADSDTYHSELPTFITEANALAVAMNLNSTTDTSASSVAIGLGAKTFAVTAGKSFQPGMFLVIADTAAPSTNSMYGQITSYSGTSLVMNILSVYGSGTKAAWTISQSSGGGVTLGGVEILSNKTLIAPVLGAALATSINFGVTALSYYGEGTFTPSIGGSATYTSQAGKYTRIGRFVHADVNLVINALGTGSTTTVSSMPFTLGASPDGNGAAGLWSSLATNCISITPQWGAAGASVTFMTSAASASGNNVNSAIFGSGASIRFSVSGQV